VSLLDDIRTYAEGAAATASRSVMRPTGWEVPGGAGIGVSIGANAKGGAGYEQLPVRKVGAKMGYLLEGGYIEGGYGDGADIGAKAVAKAVQKGVTNPAVIKALSGLFNYGGKITGSIPDMPSGSLYPLIFSPKCKQPTLSRSDFDKSAWIYIYVGGTFYVIGGDGGLLFLMDGRESVKSVLKSMVDPSAKGTELVRLLWEGSKAWCPYAGSSFSLGLAGGVIARGIGMVSIEDKTFKD
jgi:hypothetical protein